MDIDFVIPWVDGNDPAWLRLRNGYQENSPASDPCRFRDWDLLRFWFRAVEAYAPWVHKVYLITCGQRPFWLNTDHPKLCLVDHRDYIPKEYLPTFSSHVIELNLHRIPELSEHFVYFNDDMFLNAPVMPEDFFRDSLPCDSAVMGILTPLDAQEAYTHAQCNVMAFLNAHFDKRSVLRQHASRWFHPRYGRYLLKNLYCAPFQGFSNFHNQHVASSMLKSTFETVWALEPALLEGTCRSRFRGLGDVNQYIMSYYNLCAGNFSPRSPRFGKCYGIGRDNAQMYRDILSGRHKVVCVNDHPYISDFEAEKASLTAVYSQKLPNKSSYER